MKWVSHAALALVAMASAYALGAFYEASMDITAWDKGTRFTAIMLYLCHFPLHGAVADNERRKHG